MNEKEAEYLKTLSKKNPIVLNKTDRQENVEEKSTEVTSSKSTFITDSFVPNHTNNNYSRHV